MAAAIPIAAVENLQAVLEVLKMDRLRKSEPPFGWRSFHGQEISFVRFWSPNPHLRQRPATLRREGLEPGKCPLGAMLEENIDCFRRYLKAQDKGGQVLFQDAEDWIFGEGKDWQFSFENVCERLGLNPVSVREGLLDWKTKSLREALPFQVFSSDRKPRAQGKPKARETKL